MAIRVREITESPAEYQRKVSRLLALISSLVKDRRSIIAEAHPIYQEKYKEYSEEAICEEIAKDIGISVRGIRRARSAKDLKKNVLKKYIHIT